MRHLRFARQGLMIGAGLAASVLSSAAAVAQRPPEPPPGASRPPLPPDAARDPGTPGMPGARRAPGDDRSAFGAPDRRMARPRVERADDAQPPVRSRLELTDDQRRRLEALRTRRGEARRREREEMRNVLTPSQRERLDAMRAGPRGARGGRGRMGPGAPMDRPRMNGRLGRPGFGPQGRVMQPRGLDGRRPVGPGFQRGGALDPRLDRRLRDDIARRGELRGELRSELRRDLRGDPRGGVRSAPRQQIRERASIQERREDALRDAQARREAEVRMRLRDRR